MALEAGRDDISTDADGKHGQYTGVTPSHGNIYINDGTLSRGVSWVSSTGNETDVTDGGFQTVRDATYMYVNYMNKVLMFGHVYIMQIILDKLDILKTIKLSDTYPYIEESPTVLSSL